MLKNLLYAIFYFIGTFWLFACNVGQPGDTTAIAQAAAAGENHVTYSVIPGEALGMPAGAWAIPTVPGKNVDFTYSKTPEGHITATLETRRDVVLDAIFAGAKNLDAEKFLEYQKQRDFYNEQRDFAMASIQPYVDLLVPLIQAQIGAKIGQIENPPAPGPSKLETIQQWLEFYKENQALFDELRQLLPAPGPNQPVAVPTPTP